MLITTITNTCKQLLLDLKAAVQELPEQQYKMLIPELFKASVGQHTRHIIEFFQCLQQQESAGTINYDLRQRNLLIEESTEQAGKSIDELILWLDTALKDAPLNLLANYTHEQASSPQVSIKSSLVRELVYNIEHAIHHMALVKVGLCIIYPQLTLPAHFGVAPSTLRYQCEQTVGK
ncbi:MAG: DinB family protein [Aureispira sp.]|nr:DinB family protein [Aureispira sp.]